MAVEETKIILPHLANNTGNNEWYTPPPYIEAARSTMGSIDLDPASCEIANQNVKATKFFSKEENGLTKVWSGNIWLNPPYSRDLLSLFIDKLIESCFQQAIVLVHNCTETGWFRKLVNNANCILFTDHRINFLRLDGTSVPVLQLAVKPFSTLAITKKNSLPTSSNSAGELNFELLNKHNLVAR